MEEKKYDDAIDMDIETNNQNEELKYSKFKKSTFSIFTYLLKDHKSSKEMEAVMILIQIAQLISYSFNNTFCDLWKDNYESRLMINLIKYFQLIPFIQFEQNTYIIVFAALLIIPFANVFSFVFSLSVHMINGKIPKPFAKILEAMIHPTTSFFFLFIVNLCIYPYTCVITNAEGYCW